MFKPPFCPRVWCSHHEKKEYKDEWYKQDGFHDTKAFGKVPRFQCKHCKKTFSVQTFRMDYYCKKVIDYDRVMEGLCTSSCLRDISRVLRVRVSSVSNRIYRMARQFIIVQQQMINNHGLNEDLVSDGFESYTGSKYFPNNIHLLAGKESRFLYFFNLVHLRRKGKMTEHQEKMREELDKLWRPKKNALKDSFGEVVDRVIEMYGKAAKPVITLHTDEKKEYEWAIAGRMEGVVVKEGRGIVHAKTSSRALRIPSNPLAAVNIIDRQLRHNLAAYRRKTICWNRDANQAMARLTVYAGYYNWVKRFKIDNFPMKHPSHGEKGGFSREYMHYWTHDIFETRYFLSHNVELVKGTQRDIWGVRLETPLKPAAACAEAYVPRYIYL
jgi:DNA-binding Lrp family transcriptional regulator